MIKKIFIAVIVIILLVLLVPIPMRLKDGGTIEYKALIYTISKVHKLNHNSASGYDNGLIIKIFGKDFKENSVEIKNNISVVFDESYFHDNLKIRDIDKKKKNIYSNWDKNKFFKYVNEFKLPDNKKIKEFSRGMKMKLSIAVALSHSAKILILDEATSGLDPVVRDEILDIFLDYIQDEECSVLIASHITSDLEKVADYITFLDNGEIVFSKN